MTTDDSASARIEPAHDNVCICFHVPLGKLLTFIRLQHPRVPSQLSECYGAGTGCGWCIPFLERIFETLSADPEAAPELGLSTAEYLQRRREYLKRIAGERMKDVRPGEEGLSADDLIE